MDTVDFRLLFNKSSALAFVLDPDLFIVAVTDNYLRATLTRREELVGHHLFDVFPDNTEVPSSAGNMRGSLDRVLRERRPDPMGIQKLYLTGADGSVEERYWKPINTPITGPDGQVRYIIHGVEDVTDANSAAASAQIAAVNRRLHNANEELAMRTAQLNDALQTMESFTYSIAHDLRAPLRALVSFSTLLREECADTVNERATDYLRRIADAASRMDKLISDLLVYGRLTHVEPTALPISLDDAVSSVIRDLRSDLEARGAQVEVKGPLPAVMGSAVLLNHVLANLVDNALKFTPSDRKPRIAIAAAHTGEHVRLEISDNGIGIAPAYYGQIFDLFVRLHRSSDYSGTGVGLALVKKAMERMMGKVSVASKPGEGSCFSLEFRAPYNPAMRPAASPCVEGI